MVVEVEAVGTWREEGVHDRAVPLAAAAEELARECMRPASAIICTPATVRAAADSATVAAEEESSLRPLAPPAALPLRRPSDARFPEATAVTGAWWEPGTPCQWPCAFAKHRHWREYF